MAKLFRLLEKMKLVNVTPSSDLAESPEYEPGAPVGDGEAQPESHGIEPGPPPAAVPEVPPERFREALEVGGDQTAPEEFPFERIYTSAGISEPEHGFTVYTLIEMLEADEFRDLDRDTTAKVISGMLRRLPSGPVEIDDIVGDAALRDHALDAFERFLRDRLAATEAEVVEANQALQDEIDEMARRNTELMEANRSRANAERDRLDGWLVRKRTEEQRLYEAVEPFVDANPVTGEQARSPSHPAADVSEDEA